MKKMHRKEFLARTAMTAASLLGAEALFRYGEALAAYRAPAGPAFSVRALLDIPAVNGALRDMDRPTRDREHAAMGERILPGAVTAAEFTRSYLRESILKWAPGEQSAAGGNALSPDEARGAARMHDSVLFLLSVLARQAGAMSFDAMLRSMDFRRPSAGAADLADARSSIATVAQRYRPLGSRFLFFRIDADYTGDIPITCRCADTPRLFSLPSLHLHGYPGETAASRPMSPEKGNRALGMDADIAYSIDVARAVTGGLLSYFWYHALLDKARAPLAGKPEKSGPDGLVTTGARNLAARVTLAYFFLELILCRMKASLANAASETHPRELLLAAREGRFGVLAMSDIVNGTLFDGRPVFRRSGTEPPLAVNAAGGRKALPGLPLAAELGDMISAAAGGFSGEYVSTGSAGTARVDRALDFVRKSRNAFMKGAAGL